MHLFADDYTVLSTLRLRLTFSECFKGVTPLIVGQSALRDF